MTYYKQGDLIGKDGIPMFILSSYAPEVSNTIILYDIREQQTIAVEQGHWILSKLGYEIQK